MIRGSCLCGEVSWRSAGPFELMSHCHCSMCRKTHGAPFATYVATAADGFEWLGGRDRIVRYASSSLLVRPFCSQCGAKVPSEPHEGRVFMPAGGLDDDPGCRPEAHIFVASKAAWHDISDALPRFDAYPPGWGEGVPESRPREASDEAVLRGSCLCGDVAWEVEGRLSDIRNCHCSRCRKARSAAHASNLFCEPSRFRFTRGEDRLASYKLPGAERFTAVFCRRCGSAMPRVSEAYAVIPAGSIDGDPGAREREHIFVGSKASWYDIADDLPQYDEYVTD